MAYVGDFRLGKTFDIKFCTVTTTGAPTTLAGTPVISAYLDNNTTQLTAGITLSVDFDGVTGLNNVRVVATGGNGYATATNYQLVITTGTVGGTSVVGYVVAEFSIEARSALMSTTVDRTVVIDAAGLADANAVKVGPTGSGTAQTAGDIPARLPAALTANGNIKASLVEILTTALTETAGLLAGGFKKFFNVASPVLTCLGVDQTGDNYARLGAPAGASVSADIAAAKVDTAAIKVQTDKLAFTVANQVDANVLDWKSATAPAMTGDAFARLGAPAGASVSADVAAVKVDTAATLAAVDTEVAAILAAVDTEVASILALLNSARTEPAQGAPPVNPNMATKVDYLYKSWRNKKDNDGTTTKLYADDATTVDHKQATSEAAGTVTKGEWATGP